ncbi:TPA: DUF3024 domain-containing protein [Enterobacter asburiae]|nr:hypothetical protein EATA8330_12320 [Enterobacter asburiae]HEC5301781.1 DUF3024 domain-containing protein [Enterobacter asburiae]
MAFNDLEYHAVDMEVKQYVDSIRPPEHIRRELDIVYSITDQTIDIGQLRPVWQGEPGETHILPNARIKYIRSIDRWKLYWMRKDLKWHLYSTELSLADALEVVRADPDCCFFG